jgi:hypothetical protein
VPVQLVFAECAGPVGRESAAASGGFAGDLCGRLTTGDAAAKRRIASWLPGMLPEGNVVFIVTREPVGWFAGWRLFFRGEV